MAADPSKENLEDSENVQLEEEEQPSNTYIIRPNYQHKYG